MFGRRERRGRRAQAMVEFTLVFMLFMLLLIGIIEFVHLLYVYTATATAAAEAARYAATTGQNPTLGIPRYRDCDGIKQAALRVGALAGLRPEDIQITYDHGPGTGTFAQCPNPPQVLFGGERVVVQVTITYRPWVPLFPQVQLPLRAEVGRTLLGEVQIAP